MPHRGKKHRTITSLATLEEFVALMRAAVSRTTLAATCRHRGRRYSSPRRRHCRRHAVAQQHVGGVAAVEAAEHGADRSARLDRLTVTTIAADGSWFFHAVRAAHRSGAHNVLSIAPSPKVGERAFKIAIAAAYRRAALTRAAVSSATAAATCRNQGHGQFAQRQSRAAHVSLGSKPENLTASISSPLYPR